MKILLWMKAGAVGMWTSHLLHHQTLKLQESLGGGVIIYDVILIVSIIIAIVTNIKIANKNIITIP